MKRAIICHGISKDKDFVAAHPLPVTTWHWLGWLQQRYNLADVNCQNVLFPHSWFGAKKYADDVDVFENFKIDDDTRLIGWSAGTSFLLRYLYENPKIRGRHLILLAPHINGNKLLGDYFDGQIPADLMERFRRVDLFYSADDPIPGVVESAERLIKMFPNIHVHKFEHHGHFQEIAMGTREFPELWDVCKKEI
jgi:pimeloyl-ACP methyl ester carboxylesterase